MTADKLLRPLADTSLCNQKVVERLSWNHVEGKGKKRNVRWVMTLSSWSIDYLWMMNGRSQKWIEKWKWENKSSGNKWIMWERNHVEVKWFICKNHLWRNESCGNEWFMTENHINKRIMLWTNHVAINDSCKNHMWIHKSCWKWIVWK